MKKPKKTHKRRKNPKIIILYILHVSIFILNVMSYGRDNICKYVNNTDEKAFRKNGLFFLKKMILFQLVKIKVKMDNHCEHTCHKEYTLIRHQGCRIIKAGEVGHRCCCS